MADVTPIEKKRKVPRPNYIGRTLLSTPYSPPGVEAKEPALFRSCILRDIYVIRKEGF